MTLLFTPANTNSASKGLDLLSVHNDRPIADPCQLDWLAIQVFPSFVATINALRLCEHTFMLLPPNQPKPWQAGSCLRPVAQRSPPPLRQRVILLSESRQKPDHVGVRHFCNWLCAARCVTPSPAASQSPRIFLDRR
jgi:hypothetical protein